ncbi:hypothetical protein Celaphus_00007627 [Cervus elaphus hippelaphus]|uniref:NADP-dependent oxidoreductase domain-containing protein n=1 Tax=Cervus elaphus hippelaphus TaxID=46360 RepID=A0A212CAU2_CEREH|nr:hypothetical protein Celaphus_00007627 [Cervus elaphus hippelaphus]
MDPKQQKVKLNDGHFIPVLGFGTYAPEEVAKMEALEFTPFSIEVGFRHIDCAHVYQNEEQVGQAIQSKIADGTVKREDIFCTSKLWCTSFRPELVRPALEKSLKSLQLDYVDLYIIHFPLALKPGKELFPKDENGKLIFDSVDLCHTVNPNHPVLLEDPVLSAIAQKHKKTAALVALRYQIQRGVVVLAKGNNKKWIKENIQVFDFELTPEDMKAIDGLNRNIRYYEFH